MLTVRKPPRRSAEFAQKKRRMAVLLPVCTAPVRKNALIILLHFARFVLFEYKKARAFCQARRGAFFRRICQLQSGLIHDIVSFGKRRARYGHSRFAEINAARLSGSYRLHGVHRALPVALPLLPQRLARARAREPAGDPGGGDLLVPRPPEGAARRRCRHRSRRCSAICRSFCGRSKLSVLP